MRTWRRQFTVRDLLILVLFVSVLLGRWQEHRLRQQYERSQVAARAEILRGHERQVAKIRDLKEANALLQAQVNRQSPLPVQDAGYLTVGDPEKAYVRRIPSTLESAPESATSRCQMSWTYRVYLPPGHVFKIWIQPRHSGADRRLVPTLVGRFTMKILLTSDFVRVESPAGNWTVASNAGAVPGRQTLTDTDQLKDGVYFQREMPVDAPVEVLRLFMPNMSFEDDLLEVFFEPVSAAGHQPLDSPASVQGAQMGRPMTPNVQAQ